MRQSISKKIRFEVFKRDYFECQYCGNCPPASILEIDHIIPVSKNGSDDIYNLITSCFDCNRGKSNRLLTSIPKSLEDKAYLIAEKLAQVKAYDKLLKELKKYENKRIDHIQEIFNIYYPDFSFSEKFRNSVKRFLDNLDSNDVEAHMQTACNKGYSGESAVKYFCGICWNRIRG